MLMKAVRASLWKLLRGITLKGGQFNDGYERPGGTPCNGPHGGAPPERAKMTLVHARPLTTWYCENLVLVHVVDLFLESKGLYYN